MRSNSSLSADRTVPWPHARQADEPNKRAGRVPGRSRSSQVSDDELPIRPPQRRYYARMDERGRLHRESRPLAWTELLDTQRAAIRSIHALLSEIAADLQRPRQRDERDEEELVKLVRIDHARSNRVLLIDGGRGTGKTSVLVTLVDLWSRTARRRDPKYPDDAVVQAALATIAIVPTAIVDLQPLPEGAHLMLHVCGHLRRFATLGSREASGERARDAPATETTWEAFAHAAAKVWQPRNERSSRLTPEDLAEELADVEVERLDLNERFQKFVEAILAELRRQLSTDRQILLVVPIDDADLNPWRSLEVLDLLNWLKHPHVAFVLAGHSRLFGQVIYADTLGNLARPFRGLEMTPTGLEAIYGAARIKSLAKDLYNKVVPPSHRARLHTLSGAERLAAAKAALGTIGITIHAPVVRRLGYTEPTDLFEYLRDAGLAAALPAELRRLLHFVEATEPPSLNTPWTTRLSRVVLDLVGDAWSRSDFADESLRAATDDDLLKLANRARFAMLVVPRKPFPGSGTDRPRFEILDETAAVSARLPGDEEPGQVPSKLAHGLMLFVETRAARLKQDHPGLPLCKVVSCRTPLRKTKQGWPVPRFRYHLEQRAFLHYANRLLADCQGDEERFVAWYLAATLQLEEGGGEQIVRRDAHWVLARAVALFQEGNRSGACALVGIAAPEFGTSIALAARWLDIAQEVFGSDWERFLPALRRRRRRWLGLRRDDKVPNAPQAHPWRMIVEEKLAPGIAEAIAILRQGGLKLSGSYLKRLRHLDPVPGPERRSASSRIPDPQARARVFVHRLWGSVVGDREPAPWSVTLEDGELHVAPPADPWRALRPLDDGLRLTQTIEVVALAQGPDPAVARFEGQLLSHSISTVRELAWDVAVNAGSERPPNAGKRWEPWPGVNVAGEGQARRAHWPAPPLATHSDLALLYEAWNAVHRAARERIGQESGQDLVDRIALDFLDGIVDVCTHAAPRRTPLVRTSNAASWQQLAERIERVDAPERGKQPYRLRAFAAWRKIWRLFAAPELKLSDAAAAAILAGKTLTQAERTLLRSTRLELCRSVDLAPNDHRLDHPWVALLGGAAKPGRRGKGAFGRRYNRRRKT
jgi:hypothetical protein